MTKKSKIDWSYITDTDNWELFPGASGRKTYHLISREHGWAIWRQGTKRALRRFHTLLSARVFGRALIKRIKNSQLVIHDNSGRVVSVIRGDI